MKPTDENNLIAQKGPIKVDQNQPTIEKNDQNNNQVINNKNVVEKKPIRSTKKRCKLDFPYSFLPFGIYKFFFKSTKNC